MASVIQYVGDPFVDAGVAVLEHRIEKACVDFTRDDLRLQADELERLYSAKAWVGYLSVHFPNSCWCNPTMGVESRSTQRQMLLRSFDEPALAGRFCVYCQNPAQHLGDKSTVPLITGADTMTSGPGGMPGLPMCSGCQFAMQFYPLSALKVGGRPLFWWTPDHRWMFALTRNFSQQLARLIEGSPEQVTNLRWPPSRLFETLEIVMEQREQIGADLNVGDMVGCHATNYGSGPDYNELRIQKGLVEFVRVGLGHPVYRAICAEAWETEPRKAKTPLDGEARAPRRNGFYEDLGKSLYGQEVSCSRIIKRYFRPQVVKQEGTFELAGVFARKVSNMTQAQVAAIKELADQIAGSAKAAGYLRMLLHGRGLSNYVRSLVDVSSRMARAGEKPIAVETVLQAFDMAGEDDTLNRNAPLVRELIMLRIIELLPSEAVPETPADEKEEE